MSIARLAAVANAVGGSLNGADAAFSDVSTDTRTLQQGELLFALKGDNFDGADYLQDAADKGAAGAVVSKLMDVDIPQIVVNDTRRALGDYAVAWRDAFPVPAVGITGSNGKTTVKEMVASILAATFGSTDVVLATRGNFNNDIGVPLTVFRLNEQHQAAVFEMGANGAGQIQYLAGIAKPQVGIVVNAAAAHLEGFGSLAGVASAKGEMFTSLPENGIAIMNRDDSFYEYWRDRSPNVTQYSFGQNNAADFFATDIEEDLAVPELRFALHSPLGDAQVVLPMAGRHNVLNALAAAAASVAVGADLEAVVNGLQQTGNVGGRLQAVQAQNGMHIFDDSYNANPDSVAAAIDFLASQSGKRWLVLGDMGELGPDEAAMHKRVGEKAAAMGIDRLLCTGELSRETAAGFGDAAEWFGDCDAIIDLLQKEADDSVTLLVKGSRFMGLERVVKALAVPATQGANN